MFMMVTKHPLNDPPASIAALLFDIAQDKYRLQGWSGSGAGGRRFKGLNLQDYNDQTT
jgi:hypothetical protein